MKFEIRALPMREAPLRSRGSTAPSDESVKLSERHGNIGLTLAVDPTFSLSSDSRNGVLSLRRNVVHLMKNSMHECQKRQEL